MKRVSNDWDEVSRLVKKVDGMMRGGVGKMIPVLESFPVHVWTLGVYLGYSDQVWKLRAM